MDATVQQFLSDNFVPVWIEDKKDDMMAAKLGLSQEGYPNIAMYDGAGEYLGRVIGFGGRDPWFKDVQETWKVSGTLATAKASAEKDPTAWAGYSTLVAGIAGREGDALTALDRVPEAKRDAAFASARASLVAKAAWVDAEKALRATTKDAKGVEDMKAAAPKGLAIVEAWLKEHAGKNAKLDPAPLAKKGALLLLLDRKAEAIEIATKILHDWPESPQAQSILRGMR